MKLKYIFETVNLGDEIVAVPVGKDAFSLGGVFKFNNAGLEIMKMLENDITEEKIVKELSKRYENDIDLLQLYVHDIITVLKGANALIE